MATKKLKRDLTEKQFLAAMKRNGFTQSGVSVFDYWKIEGTGVRVSTLNANTNRRRSILAYMIRTKKAILDTKRALREAREAREARGED